MKEMKNKLLHRRGNEEKMKENEKKTLQGRCCNLKLEISKHYSTVQQSLQLRLNKILNITEKTVK